MTPLGHYTLVLSHMENRKSEVINDAKGSGHFVMITVDKDLLFPLTKHRGYKLWFNH